MKVVGAGFGRTGTLTQKVALEMLGFGPCYHMAEVIEHPEHVAHWEAATRGEPVDWARFFHGWGATVDWPGCSFYKEILAAHPDAKVLLSVRDPDRWHQSCLDTIHQTVHRFPLSLIGPLLPRIGRPLRMTRALIWGGVFDGRFTDKAHAISVFNAHIEEVKATIPADRLLVYEVKQGWEPLCAFLGVPVPDQPFPHVNDTEEFRGRIRMTNLVAWGILLSPLALAAAALAWWL